MAPKLSSRQQAQVAFLQLLPQKLQRIYSVIEQMAGPRVDETLVRGLGRLLDDIKGNAASLSLGSLADTAGRMGMLIRGGGGLPMKVRGLTGAAGELSRSTTMPPYVLPPRPARTAKRTSAGSSSGLGRPPFPALGEKPVDQRAAHQDDHEVNQHADQKGYVGERAQDEPSTNGSRRARQTSTSNDLR